MLKIINQVYFSNSYKTSYIFLIFLDIHNHYKDK